MPRRNHHIFQLSAAKPSALGLHRIHPSLQPAKPKAPIFPGNSPRLRPGSLIAHHHRRPVQRHRMQICQLARKGSRRAASFLCPSPRSRASQQPDKQHQPHTSPPCPSHSHRPPARGRPGGKAHTLSPAASPPYKSRGQFQPEPKPQTGKIPPDSSASKSQK